jgi:uncharacterized protein (DUF885 family)
MQRRTKRIVGWSALALVAIVAYLAYRTVWGKPFSINMLANRQTLEFLVENPELFTEVGLIDGTVFDHHSDKLAASSLKKRDADYAQFAKFLSEVREFDRGTLNRQDQITYDILVDQWQSQLNYRKFNWLTSEGLYPISPMFGLEVGLPSFMETYHVVKNDKTARNYVRRLEAMKEKLDGATTQMQWQATQGVVLPPALLDRSLVVIHDTIAAAPADNALVTSFVTRMDKVKDLDAARKRELTREAVAAVSTSVYPAYTRMSAALEALKPQATTQAAGVGRLPDGPAYYAESLRQMTTTNYSPEQVHQLGLSEVARITKEMDSLLTAQGLTDGTVGTRMTALSKDRRFLLPNTDEGRKQMLDRYQQLLDQVAARMPEYFRSVPTTRLTVERVPAGQEKGTSAAYYQQAAMDGSRPGTFFANLRNLEETPTYGMKTLAYHEGIPGHHFQISTALTLKNLPLLRQQTLYTAYAEGWALYAEQFAAEIGMYQDDPWGNLGRLQMELLRAARLVVDTGLHSKGWSREQAIDYMVNATGMAPADVTSEVERYMAAPGQACAYKVGELKILELREKAKAALGPKFNLKDFHAVVLENGGVPLTVLEQLVNEWIVRARSGGTAMATSAG